MRKKQATIFLEDFQCPKCGGALNFDGKEIWCSFVGDQRQKIDACDYGLSGGKTLRGLIDKMAMRKASQIQKKSFDSLKIMLK